MVGEGGGHILKEVKELGALEDMLGLEGLLEVEVDSDWQNVHAAQ